MEALDEDERYQNGVLSRELPLWIGNQLTTEVELDVNV